MQDSPRSCHNLVSCSDFNCCCVKRPQPAKAQDGGWYAANSKLAANYTRHMMALMIPKIQAGLNVVFTASRVPAICLATLCISLTSTTPKTFSDSTSLCLHKTERPYVFSSHWLGRDRLIANLSRFLPICANLFAYLQQNSPKARDNSSDQE